VNRRPVEANQERSARVKLNAKLKISVAEKNTSKAASKSTANASKKDPLADQKAALAWPDESACRLFRKKTLRWFSDNARDLPWRRTRDPYQVWISEVMLQQTQVATVIDYWKRFVATFPTVTDLAKADQAQVLKLWEGLGYYRRAKQLHNAALVIQQKHSGRFPTTLEEVLALPGIGRYTAGAVLSIACDQQLPILEGNTIRLYSRLLGITTDPTTTANQKLLWAFASQIVPKCNAGQFNQGLMEIGGQICKPQQPSCLLCPVQSHCKTFATGQQQSIPTAKTRQIKFENQIQCIVLIQRKGKYLLRLCQPGERWAGLWDLFRLDLTQLASEKETTNPFFFDAKTKRWMLQEVTEKLGLLGDLELMPWSIKHAVTRFRIQLHSVQAQQISGRLSKSAADFGWKWVERSELSKLALNVTARKFVDHHFK